MNWLVIMWKQVNSIEFGAIPTEKGWNTMKSNGKRLKFTWFRWNLLEILWKQCVSIEIQAYACVCTRYTRFFDRTRSSELFDGNKKSDNRTHERSRTREPLFRIKNRFSGSVGLLFPEEGVQKYFFPNTMPHLYGERTWRYETMPNGGLNWFF